MIFFTVFTPTFNRAYTLAGVYNSLLAQTVQDFEWIIIDDGSTDNTESIVSGWMMDNKIHIRYIKKNNEGKHVAINLAAIEAKGQLFLIFDSDDKCSPLALERFKHHWDSIPEEQRNEYAGVIALSSFSDGSVIGTRFPEDIVDGKSYEIFDRYKIRGDKWNLLRTDVIKKYPFPVFEGEKFLSEGLIWNRICLNYKFRHINEILYCPEYLNDGLTKSSLINRVRSPKGTLLYYKEASRLPLSIILHLKHVTNLFRFGIHCKQLNKSFSYAPSFGAALFGFICGGLVYLWDKTLLKMSDHISVIG